MFLFSWLWRKLERWVDDKTGFIHEPIVVLESKEGPQSFVWRDRFYKIVHVHLYEQNYALPWSFYSYMAEVDTGEVFEISYVMRIKAEGGPYWLADRRWPNRADWEKETSRDDSGPSII